MLNKLVIFLCLIILNACYPKVPAYIKKEIKYNPYLFKNNVNMAKGFYRDIRFDNMLDSMKLYDKEFFKNIEDSLIKVNAGVTDIIFYKNGICLMGYLGNLNNTRLNGYEELMKDINKKNKSVFFYSGLSFYWGLYNLLNDTIKIKVIQRNSFIAAKNNAFEQWYKIIDKNTLQPILFKALTKSDYIKDWNATVYLDSKYYPPSKFYPIKDSNLINPNYCWLLNKKWFWQNKEDYKAWKKLKK